MYIGAEQPEKAISYLDYIIDLTDKSLREDIQCYARIMKLMALFDMQEYNAILKYGMDFQKFYHKLKHPNRVQLAVLQMLETLAKAPLLTQKEILKEDYSKLKLLKENNFEKRAFIYLDVLPWIMSKVTRKNIEESVKEEYHGKIENKNNLKFFN